MNSNMRFLNELTPDQIQKLISAIGIPWQNYKPSADGWINFDDTDLIGYPANSTIGINIQHGGFCDHYLLHTGEGNGDILDLWCLIEKDREVVSEISRDDRAEAIRWARETLGIKRQVQKPELREGFQLANDYLQSDDRDFSQIPADILFSDLPSNAKVVWAYIQYRAGKKGFSWQGVRKTANDLGIAVNTVRSALNTLKQAKLLEESDFGQTTAKFPVTTSMDNINLSVSKIDTTTVSKIDTGVYQKLTRGVSKTDTKPDKGTKEMEPDKDEPKKESYGLNEDVQPLPSSLRPAFQRYRNKCVSQFSEATQNKLNGLATDDELDKIFNGNTN